MRLVVVDINNRRREIESTEDCSIVIGKSRVQIYDPSIDESFTVELAVWQMHPVFKMQRLRNELEELALACTLVEDYGETIKSDQDALNKLWNWFLEHADEEYRR